jgi:hypothetical protein
MKLRFIAVGVVSLVCALVVWASNIEADLVGVWKESRGLGAASLYSIRADGSLVITPMGGGGDFFGTWSLRGGIVTIKGKAIDRTITFQVVSVGKDELNVRNAPGERITTMVRVGAAPMDPSPQELAAATPEGKRAAQEYEAVLMTARVDKAVLNNARQLAAASDQYFLENGVSTVALKDIIGPTNYIKALNIVSSEAYPSAFTQGVTITISGIAGARTITYAP